MSREEPRERVVVSVHLDHLSAHLSASVCVEFVLPAAGVYLRHSSSLLCVPAHVHLLLVCVGVVGL